MRRKRLRKGIAIMAMLTGGRQLGRGHPRSNSFVMMKLLWLRLKQLVIIKVMSRSLVQAEPKFLEVSL